MADLILRLFQNYQRQRHEFKGSGFNDILNGRGFLSGFIFNFQTMNDYLEPLKDSLEMYDAEMRLEEALKSLEEAEKELYLAVYWMNYAEENKN